ncbi:ESX secretion-associated protein EspG [Thermocrispum agreste]|uniref:ESX secretion-associated protein EspG n=1 Tax=Thermocrispum agreste TaxID=37925 RepID=UPI00042208D7
MSERTLTPMQFDFLWEQLGLGEHPYPLQVPSHGKTMNERVSLKHRVERELRSLGLKNSYGELEPQLDTWLRVLARPQVSVDAAHIPEFRHPPVCAIAAHDGENAVLVKQTKEAITFRPIYPDALASEIISLLPPCQRGTERSVTLSLDEALRTRPALVKVGPDPAELEQQKEKEKEKAEAKPKSRFGLWRREPEEPKPEPVRRKPLSERTSGNPQKDYALLIAQPRLRGGQLAANARDEAGQKFRSPALAWFDTVTGRYLSLARPGPDGHEWITVSGADAKTLRTRLAEMVSSVQAQAGLSV